MYKEYVDPSFVWSGGDDGAYIIHEYIKLNIYFKNKRKKNLFYGSSCNDIRLSL